MRRLLRVGPQAISGRAGASGTGATVTVPTVPSSTCCAPLRPHPWLPMPLRVSTFVQLSRKKATWKVLPRGALAGIRTSYLAALGAVGARRHTADRGLAHQAGVVRWATVDKDRSPDQPGRVVARRGVLGDHLARARHQADMGADAGAFMAVRRTRL